MRSKRKSITTNLLAVIVILAIALCLALGVTYTADCSETQISDDAEIATISDTYEDFSSYTDQQLPDKIDRNNIKQYVPVSKFGNSGTTVYNGRNYGFVLFCDAGTNHVLLFKEVYTPHNDNGGYDVTLQVVYQNSFFKSGNTILNASSPYKISLANLKFDNYLYDADMTNNVLDGRYNCNTDSGAYFTQLRYENSLSYFNEKKGDKNALVVSSAIVQSGDTNVFPQNPLALGDVNVAIANAKECADLIYSNNSVFNDAAAVGVTLDFPLTRQGQIEQFGGLRKNLTIDRQSGVDEYISQSGDYFTVSLRVANDNDSDYYVYNNVSFDVCRYTSIEEHNVSEGCYLESVFSVTGATCGQSSQMTESDETFEYKNYQRFSPMAKSNLFNFAPAQAGKYSVYVPTGYYLTVNGIAQSSNEIDVDASGCKIAIGARAENNTGDVVYPRMLPQDFYNGEIAFTNLSIKRHQGLNINDVFSIDDVAYEVLRSDVTNNDVFVLDAGDKSDFVDLYITDVNLNVLAKASKKDGALYVNYPLKANNTYYIVCVNRSGESLDLTIDRQGDMTLDEYKYSDVAGLYYAFSWIYTYFFNVEDGIIYDEDMNLYPSEDALLQSDKTYYVYSTREYGAYLYLSYKAAWYYQYGQEIISQNEYNELFSFSPSITASYRFEDGTYDVYDIDRDSDPIAENVNACELQANTAYLIIKRQYGGLIKIYIDGDTLSYGENAVSPSYNDYVYVLNVEEKSRLDITVNSSDGLEVYDSEFNMIFFDHGYLLEEGKYYIILRMQGEYIITVGEYIQQVNITFYVDGKIYEDTTGNKYYYGKKATLPVPVKDRYDFDGWSLSGSHVFVTDENGVTLEELYEDEITLVANWTLRYAVMQINFEDGASKWWTGNKVVSQNPGELSIYGDIDEVINQIKKALATNNGYNKQGYFISTLDYVKTSTEDNVDYYEFTPVWQVEKYYIEFILPYPDITTYYTAGAVNYGAKIAKPSFPTEAFEYVQNKELYYLVGWKLSENSSTFKFTLGNALIDLTPGFGSEYDYDSNGDGIVDSTFVSLSADAHYVDYAVRINSKSYAVGQDGYDVGALGRYGYTESNYYGHNVYLKATDGKTFSFDSVINVSDLTSYWRSGNKSVTVDLSLVDSLITVALSYNYSGSGNPTSYVGSQGNVTLKAAYVRTYKFNYWTVDGNRIDTLNYANLGIKQYYSNVNGVSLSKSLSGNLSRSSMKPTSLISYTVSDAATYVDLSRFNPLVGVTFTISSTAEEVTFVNGNCRDTRIVVDARSTKLLLNFDSVTMRAKSNKSVIDAEGCPDLEIYSYNYVYLYAGEVNAEESEAAILCQDLTLSGRNIEIYGGDQIAGYGYANNHFLTSAATAGIKSENIAGRTLRVSASYVYVKGGKGAKPTSDVVAKDGTATGENGEDGLFGFDGGRGAVAIYILGDVILSEGSKLECVGGKGGDGGDGKAGGKGGPGRNGSFGVTHIDPGNGGKGGDGGRGGDGGKAMVCNNFSGNRANLTATDGEGGAGGAGGDGGAPGDTVTTIFGTEKKGSEGAPGEPGKPGDDGASYLA